MPRTRFRVHYSGRVQGVGFRFTCERIAQSHKVGGYVRNLEDGGVELVVEGEPASVQAYLDAIRASLGAKIWSEDAVEEPPGEPPFLEFSIRY